MNTVVDAARWEELYRQEYPRLHRALSAVLLDGEAARDALHEAFLEGLRRPVRDQNVAGWLYRVALRKSVRPSRRLMQLLLPTSHDGGLEAALDRIEVGALLRYLSSRQRAVVIARFYLGLRHAEIASVLGVREGTVSATLSHALAKMRVEVDHGE